MHAPSSKVWTGSTKLRLLPMHAFDPQLLVARSRNERQLTKYCRRLTGGNMSLRTATHGRTRSDVELAEWAAIDRSASGRTRPTMAGHRYQKRPLRGMLAGPSMDQRSKNDQSRICCLDDFRRCICLHQFLLHRRDVCNETTDVYSVALRYIAQLLGTTR